MGWRRFRNRVLLLLLVTAVAIGVVGVWIGRQPPVAPPRRAAIVPSTSPAPATTSAPTSAPAPLDYVSLVHVMDAAMPATQPLDYPVHLAEASHLICRFPVYLDRHARLWITHPEAPDIERALGQKPWPDVFVVSDRVVYVDWHTMDDGTTVPWAVVRRVDGSHEIVRPAARARLAQHDDWHWDRAISWSGRIVVPLANRVCVIDPANPGVEAISPELGPVADGMATPQVVQDTRGLLAWIPAEAGKPGGQRVCRFVDGRWGELAREQWPANILHLVPLLDGSVLQVLLKADGHPSLATVLLESHPADETAVADLVDKLSDPDPDVREKASGELLRYGPSLWPIIDKLMPNQPAETQVTLRVILRSKTRPTLGNLELLDGVLRVMDREADGGLLLLADAGVRVPRNDDTTAIVTPAWIRLCPGQPVRLVREGFLSQLNPDRTKLWPWGNGWVIGDRARGICRSTAATLIPVVRKAEGDYDRFEGIDFCGRWVLGSSRQPGRTLLIDPTLPDPTPRLPAWSFSLSAGQIGWTSKGWPAMKSGGTWALAAAGWQPVDPKDGEIITQPPVVPADAPLLVDPAGTRYFDGHDLLRIVRQDGRQIDWRLPPSATGHGAVSLLRSNDGRLFLINQPGRVVRLRVTGVADSPLAVEATFTHGIPNEDTVRRIWVDPAGRISIVVGDQRLVVLFPDGRIPAAIRALMTADEEQKAEESEGQ